MKIGIKSDFDCMIMIDENKFLLEENLERIEIETVKNTQTTLLVYPTKERNLLSYAVSLECGNEKLKVNSLNTELLQVGEGLFELLLKKNKIKLAGNGRVHNHEQNGISFVLIEGEPNIVYLNGEWGQSVVEFEQRIKKVAFEVENSVPYFIATSHEAKFVCLFCPIERVFFQFDAVSFQINEGQMEIVERINGHAKHGRLTVLELSGENGVKIKSRELLYLRDEPVRATNMKVMPLAFFESIKAGDFNLAKSYLSDELASEISSQMLQEYFGEFDKVIPYNFHQQHGLSMCVVASSKVKIFLFKIEGGKIREIDFVREYNKN